MQTQHDDFDDVQGRGAIPIVHDQDLAISEARLSVDVGISRRFGASLLLPVRAVVARIRYLDGAGRTVELVEPSTHHRNETLTGLADPLLLGSVTHAWGPVRLTARAGMSIPLGRTEEDPFANATMPHQHIQMGTGTVNPIAALEAAYSWDRWRVAGFAFTQQALYENSKGYHAGDRYAAGIALRRAFGGWTVRGGAEIQAETFERWNGIRYTDEGNQGRFDAMVAAGASWAATRELTVDLALKIPFVNHVVGGQLDVPAIVEIGAAWTFGARPAARADRHEHEHEHDHDHDHDHEHEHEHEHEHGNAQRIDTSGADVADLGKDGARVDLVPVPGKLTIFDFWAPWCEPCKTLEPALVELARKHPDVVAIRRIDVVDWETPVVAQHLTPGAFDLPHLKIYDARGALVLEESSGPGKLMALIESVRTLVEAAATPASSAPASAPPTPAPEPTPAPAPAPTPAPMPKAKAKARAPIHIVVTERGFEPEAVTVPRGTPVTLQFLRKTAKTCATEIVMEHDGKRIERPLPLGETVELTLTFPRAGTITYACAMNMIRGTIIVR